MSTHAELLCTMQDDSTEQSSTEVFVTVEWLILLLLTPKNRRIISASAELYGCSRMDIIMSVLG